MVLGNERQIAISQAVNAAVSGPQKSRIGLTDEQSRDSRAEGSPARETSASLVRLQEPCFDISQALLYRVALAVTANMLDDNAARFFTVAMAANTISHKP